MFAKSGYFNEGSIPMKARLPVFSSLKLKVLDSVWLNAFPLMNKVTVESLIVKAK